MRVIRNLSNLCEPNLINNKERAEGVARIEGKIVGRHLDKITNCSLKINILLHFSKILRICLLHLLNNVVFFYFIKELSF